MTPSSAPKSFAASASLLALLLACSVPGFAADLPPELNALRTKAEGGNPIASYNLGLAYLQGRDIPADFPEAFVWLSLARESGNTGKALDSLMRQMSASQLAEGQRRLGERRAALASGAAGSTGSAPTTTASDNFARQQEELRAALADNKRLTADVSSLRAEAAQAKASLAAKAQELEQAKSEAAKAEAQKDAELMTLRESFARGQTKAASENAAEASALKEQLKKSLSAQEQASEKGRLLEVELAKLKQTAASAAAAEKKAGTELELERSARLALEQTLAAQKKVSDAGILSARNEAAAVMALRQQLEAAQAASIKAETAMRELSTQKSVAEKSLATATTERDVLAVRMGQAEAAVRSATEAEARIASLTKELEAARQSAVPASVGSASPAQAEELAGLRQRVATLESERSGLQVQLASARIPVPAASNEAETGRLKKQLADMESKLAAASEEVNKLRAAAAEEAAKPRTAAPAPVAKAETAMADASRVPPAVTTPQPTPRTIANGASVTEPAAALAPEPAFAAPSKSVGVVYLPPTRPNAARAAEAAASAATVVPPPAPVPRTHIVRAGDTLSSISRQYYGTADRWEEIYNANRTVVKKPERLPLGGAIKIP